MNNSSLGKGFFYAILAYVTWGVLPLYWKFLAAIDSMHILAFRILLALVLVGIILIAKKDLIWLSSFKEPKKAALMIMSALFLTCNWGLYIWTVNSGHTLAASLGYYINPLVSISLGLLFFRERLKPLQWAAVIIALAGVVILTILSGALPWASLGLAFTFGFYGMLKKKISLSALESLGAETLVSVPIGILLLCLSFQSSPPVFLGFRGLAYIGALPVHTLVLLCFAGLVSTFPLYCFAQGAKLLPLSALGFCQFISPTISLFLGVFVFGEPFPLHDLIAFPIIWTAVILYLISLRPSATPSREK